jgi:hypothetical protein
MNDQLILYDLQNNEQLSTISATHEKIIKHLKINIKHKSDHEFYGK